MGQKQRIPRGVRRLIGAQFLMAGIVAAVYLLFAGALAAKSAGYGGLCCCLPNLLFARTVFAHRGAQAAKHIITAFYGGEVLKLLLTAMLMAMVFKFAEIDFIAFFIGFILVQSITWLAAFVL